MTQAYAYNILQCLDLMPLYLAYGLTVQSDLVLPGLSSAEGVPPDVTIFESEISDAEIASGWESSEKIIVSYRQRVWFAVEGGRTVRYCFRRFGVEPDELSARLLGEIMAGLMRQRGLLVVHACAVEKDGQAVAFFGESGWGKSTLAAYLCQNGYRLLTDDVMVIDGLNVIPSYPQIRLREDSAVHLQKGTEWEAIERNGPKWAQNGVPMPDHSVPLRHLYLLEPEYREHTEVIPVAPSDALMALVMHTRAKTLINTNAPTLLREHLAQCARLVHDVSPKLLRRRHSLNALGDILALVEASLARPVPTAS